MPDSVYEATLGPWRASLRRIVMTNLERESRIIAAMQVCIPHSLTSLVDIDIGQSKIRTPLLDRYFVYTSSLGTHTFFMIVLPVFFFFGFRDIGRGYVSISISAFASAH